MCYATIIENILSEGLFLPNFTRDAIIRSFLGLLNEKPVNHITVKDIVEDCGINRNSFYYHFQDLPALNRGSTSSRGRQDNQRKRKPRFL